MKSFKEFLSECQEQLDEYSHREIVTVKRAKDDGEIFQRLKKLEKAGLWADSGSNDVRTEIMVNKKDLDKAKKILGNIVVEGSSAPIDEATYYRIPEKVVGNAVFALMKRTEEMYKWLKAGNDFKREDIEAIKNWVKTIETSVTAHKK